MMKSENDKKLNADLFTVLEKLEQPIETLQGTTALIRTVTTDLQFNEPSPEALYLISSIQTQAIKDILEAYDIIEAVWKASDKE